MNNERKHFNITTVTAAIIVLILTQGCSVSTIDTPRVERWIIPTSLPKEYPKPDKVKVAANKGMYSYVVKGKRYWVKPVAVGYKESGIASWYGKKFHGRLTANQERYNMHELTAAHKSLPLPSYIKVYNHKNDKSVIVRVNDRGPFVEGRIVDLSYAAAKRVGIDKIGLAPVTIEVIDMPANRSSYELEVSKLSNRHRVGYIQIGTYKKRSNAFNVMRTLKRYRLTSHLVKADYRSTADMHQVRLGPFNTPQELAAVKKLLDRNDFKNYRIIYK